jgi:hypothetical protein
MGGKRLGVLKEAVPNLSRAAVLFGSDSSPHVAYLRMAEATAPSLGVAVTPVDVVDSGGTERAGAAFASQPAGRRPHRHSTSLYIGEPWIDHHIAGAASIAGNPSVSDFRSRGRPAFLRLRSDRFMARGGNLRRSYSARRETGRTDFLEITISTRFARKLPSRQCNRAESGLAGSAVVSLS